MFKVRANGKVTGANTLGRWLGPIIIYYLKYVWRDWGKPRITSIRIDGQRVKTRTWYILSTKQKC